MIRASDPQDYLQLISVTDGDPSTNDLGWAHGHINAVPFKRQTVTTSGDYQFTSYYGADGKLIFGRRNLSDATNTWSLLQTEFTSFNINDAHNTSSIAIDGDGFLHVAWGVHGNPLLYSRSTTSVVNDDPFEMVGGTVGNAASITDALPFQSAGVTYPEFTNIPGSGDLLINYRRGSSGDGEWQLVRWDNQNDVWNGVHTALNSGDTGPQPWFDDDYSGDSLPDTNAYPNGLMTDSKGRMHITWTWRTGGDSPSGFGDYQSNHNVMYAYSDNQGVDWYRDDGTIYQRNNVHDIDENNAVPVVQIPEGSSLINATNSAIGPDDNYYMTTYWAPGASQGNHLRQIMLVEYDGTQWKTHQVSERNPENGNNRIHESQLRNFSLRRPTVMVDDENRVLVVYADHQRGGGVTVAYSELASRDDWVTFDLTQEDLGSWSPMYDLNRWQTDGVLSMYYQPTGLGSAASEVSILEWDARAYFDANPQPSDRLVLTVNREARDVSISNPLSTPIEIDGYSVTSKQGLIDEASFAGLGTGWSSSMVSATRVTQLRDEGTTAFADGVLHALGALFAPAEPTEFGVETTSGDLKFNYTQPGFENVVGLVQYVGDVRKNNLVLTIDENGMAAIQNESTLSVDIEGYTITSAGGLIDSDGWNSLDEQNAEGGLWAASPISDEFRVTELMDSGATTFTSLKGFNLGQLYNDSGAGSVEDLTFQFLVAGESEPMMGIVVFGDLPDLTPGLDGDFNGDGFVNLADYVVWRNNLGAPDESVINNVGDGLNGVDAADYHLWKVRFGEALSAALETNETQVPEPSTSLLCLVTFAAIALNECCRGNFRSLRSSIFAVLSVACSLSLAIKPTLAKVVAEDSFVYAESNVKDLQGGSGWAQVGWKSPTGISQYLCDENLTFPSADGEQVGTGRAVAVHGTGNRNNPLRRELSTPFSGDELYVRFLLRYDATSLDNPGRHGNGEFFVLWLDDIDGGDGAGHNPNVPNIGINALPADDNGEQGKNVFMVRIGSENTSFSEIEVKGNHTYVVIARLSKTQPGPLGSYDHLELWIDPEDGMQDVPDATAYGRGSNLVRWVGFATGRKTELSDFVLIDELVLGERWADVMPGGEKEQTPEPEDITLARNASGRVDFRRDVYPILSDHCFACHQGHDAESGYRLDMRDELLGMFQGKPLAVPGESEQSPIYTLLVTDDEDLRMPQGTDPLPDADIEVIRRWIDQGLDWDDNLLPSQPLQSNHWAYQKIQRPTVPGVQNTDQIRNPIDAFIDAKLKEEGLEPSPRADRRTLYRRLALTYTGLPPTPEEIESFLADDSEDAYRKAIDRLLSSPHYGERWARHWLDLARWAESDGHQHNESRRDAWRYRDYVINSFNTNKRHNDFLREQIAGDEIEPYEDENLIATGFLASGRYSDNELDKPLQRNDILVDITNATGSAILGLTIHCAQCHTHKFDPITARDYYRFGGFFVKGQPGRLLLRGDASQAEYEKAIDYADEQYEIIGAVRSRIEAKKRIAGQPVFAITSDLKNGMSGEQKKRYGELKKEIETFETTWGFYSPVTSPNSVAVPFHDVTSPLEYAPSMLERMKPVLLIRGDIDAPGQEVDVGWPAIFGKSSDDAGIRQRPRSALVDWLVSRDNPLVARVWVNRIWQYHFGTGLVSTPDDFGTQGDRPSHPRLLDWLAVELIESGWNTGHIQRLIVESDTFQRSSQFVEDSAVVDPENKYYWRWKPRRLEAETIRDAMLAASGLLDPTVGGPSVPLKECQTSLRRTIYLEQKRGELPVVQQLFDAPTTLTCSGQRLTSTVPLQPLFLLNNPEVFRYAEALAERVSRDVGADPRHRSLRVFEIVLGRPPTDRELDILIDFLQSDSVNPDETPNNRFVQFCHGMLNLNEFIYIP
ncbi:DUF1553 domain-containing protein [Aeoliella sp.]|uniref:DUF1553 domain-containing protein n=1 Tax=Aeoliella sp. TaxID=2795800 RepID=UPI003CCB89CC